MIQQAPTFETATKAVQLGYGPLIAAEIGTFNHKDHESIARLLIAKGRAAALARFFTSFELKHSVELLKLIITQRNPDALAMVIEQFESYTAPRGERPPQLKPAEAREIGALLLTHIDGLHGELEDRSYEPRLGDVTLLTARVQGVLERLPK